MEDNKIEYIKIPPIQTAVRCLICGETALVLDGIHSNISPIVCDKCKAAVMKVRKEMENKQ